VPERLSRCMRSVRTTSGLLCLLLPQPGPRSSENGHSAQLCRAPTPTGRQKRQGGGAPRARFWHADSDWVPARCRLVTELSRADLSPRSRSGGSATPCFWRATTWRFTWGLSCSIGWLAVRYSSSVHQRHACQHVRVNLLATGLLLLARGTWSCNWQGQKLGLCNLVSDFWAIGTWWQLEMTARARLPSATPCGREKHWNSHVHAMADSFGFWLVFWIYWSPN